MNKHFDLTQMYRNSIGVDRLARMFENVDRMNTGNYPPYNIISDGDDSYTIEMAVAGFKDTELSVSTQNGQLIVVGEKDESRDDESRTYLYQGISSRQFKRVFDLAEYIEVQSAKVTDGILVIQLHRIIPDALKPKQIEVMAS